MDKQNEIHLRESALADSDSRLVLEDLLQEQYGQGLYHRMAGFYRDTRSPIPASGSGSGAANGDGIGSGPAGRMFQANGDGSGIGIELPRYGTELPTYHYWDQNIDFFIGGASYGKKDGGGDHISAGIVHGTDPYSGGEGFSDFSIGEMENYDFYYFGDDRNDAGEGTEEDEYEEYDDSLA